MFHKKSKCGRFCYALRMLYTLGASCLLVCVSLCVLLVAIMAHRKDELGQEQVRLTT